MQVRTVLYHQKVLDVTVESKAKPKEPEAMVSKEDKGQYKTELEAWEMKAAKTNAIILPTISGRLMTYVEDENDPAKIWSILHDRFQPTCDVTIAKALKYIVTLRIANDGNMEAHIQNFTVSVELRNIPLTSCIPFTAPFLCSRCQPSTK